MTPSPFSRRQTLGLGAAAGLSLATPSWSATPVASPVVETAAGKVRGQTVGEVHIFKGIPYGAPTGGGARFKAPKAAAAWTGVRDCTAWGPTAPQAGMAEAGGSHAGEPPMPADQAKRMADFMTFLHGMSGDEAPQGEDCLVLNVWSRSLSRSHKRPVMFWIHGGGYTSGAGSWNLYDGAGLAGRPSGTDAIVVTINHRLGALGHLHLAQFGGGDYAASGNAAMQDQVLALQWVRDNIEAFGGDPERVMIFGSSGGGAKCTTLLGMPSAKGLFHRANIMSGPHYHRATADEAAATAVRLMARLGIDPKDFRKLHDVPFQQLVSEAEKLNRPLNGAAVPPVVGLQPVVDGVVLPAQPMEPVASPIGARIPVLIGSGRDDINLLMYATPAFAGMTEAALQTGVAASHGDKAPQIIAAYKAERPDATPSQIFLAFQTDYRMGFGVADWAERRAAAPDAGPVYVYRFDFATPALGGVLGATHGNDIPFAMDNYRSSSMAGDRPGNAAMAKTMSDTWVRFAETCDPNNPSITPWKPYRPPERATMLLDVPATLVDDPRAGIRDLVLKRG